MVENKIKKLLFLLLFFAVQNLWATDYYVSSSSGNDGNSGTSSSSPWRTLGKFKWKVFKPGDRILLKSGDTWNEKLMFDGNGNSSNYITITSYGSGNKPIITNSDGAVQVSKNYIKVSNLHAKVTGNGGSAIYNGGQYNIIENCFAEGINRSSYNLIGIRVWANSNGTVIRNNEVRYVTEGIKAAGTTSQAVIIEYNYIHDINAGGGNGQDGIAVGADGLDYSGTYIRHNEITGWGDDAIDLFFGRNIVVEYNKIHDPQTSGFEGNGIKVGGNSSGTEYGNIIRYNTIYNLYTSPSGGGGGNNSGILIQDERMKVYGNLLYNISGSGILFHGGSGSEAFNNTVIIDANAESHRDAIGVSYNPSVVIKNNILSAPNGNDLDAGGASVQGGYNCLINDKSVAGNSRYNNTNSSDLYSTDPKFVNSSAKDFRLQTSSPCYKTGASLLSNLLDITGLPALIDNPNRGAFQSTGQAPTGGDNSAPKLTDASLSGSNTVVVTFSESLDKGYAENKSNYSINNGISISEAVLTSSNTVTLKTSNHASGTSYTLTVKYAKDLSGNTTSGPQTIQYQSGQSGSGDKTPPSIINAQLSSSTSLVITFSEAVDRGYSENKSNYYISGISISKAVLTSSNQVTLTTSSHSTGKTYTLKVLHAKDIANNAVMNLSFQYQSGTSSGEDKTPPQVSNAKLLNSTTLLITFSEAVDRGYSENKSNYYISGISISKAALTSSNQVTLTTSSHSSGQSYTLKALHAKDVANNAVMNLTYQYQFSSGSVSGSSTTYSINDINASSYKPGFIPAKTTDGKGYDDGDQNSRWIANYSGSQDLIYNLGSVKNISGTKISFYGFNSKAAYTYSISVSESKKSWKTVVNRNVSGNNEWTTDLFSESKIQYVKITIHGYQNVSVASLWEVQILGSSELSKTENELEPETTEHVPDEFMLYQNYPNPFNPATTIKYSLPIESSVKLSIYNLLGELITELVNRVEQEGTYELNWNAADLASGTYIYTIEASPVDGSEGFKVVKKMMLLK